jgi:hypothetical protein
MNKKLLSKLCVLAMFVTALIPTNASAYGQKWDFGRDWQLLNGSGYSNYSAGVATSDDGRIVYSAVPTGVLYSDDSGATWSSRSTGLNMSGGMGIAGIATNADGSILSVVQNGGYIYVSRDYGVTWEERTNVSTDIGSGLGGWLTVAMSDSGQYIITTRAGTLYRSNDFGATFTQKIIDSNVPGNSDEIYTLGISGDGQRIIVPTSHYGKVYLSLNYGASFSALSGLPNVAWSAAGISGDGNTLVAAAYLGNIWASHDAGSTWTESVVDLYPPYKNWGHTTLSYDGQIIGMTRYGYKLLTSDNGGNSWEVKAKSYSQVWKDITSSRDGRVMYAGAILDHGSGGVYKSIPTYIYTDAGTVTLLLDHCVDSFSATSVQAASVILSEDTASAIVNVETSTYVDFGETDTALWGADYNYGSTQDQNSCQESPLNGTVTLSRGRFIDSSNSVAFSETNTNTTDFLQYIGNIESSGTYTGTACGNMNAKLRNVTNVTTSCTNGILGAYSQLTYATPIQVRDSSVKIGILGQASGKIFTFVKVKKSVIVGAPKTTTWVATETYTVTSS